MTDLDPKSEPKADNPVAAYKHLLREMIDRRPSGTRLKIARALGKHKSFVSQIINPAYTVPVPAKHLATIFDLCHFSGEERRLFLDAYDRAHPGRQAEPREIEPEAADPDIDVLEIQIPVLSDPRRRADLIDTIRQFADHAIALARRWEERDTSWTKGGPPS